jgi:hypothetical protein
MSFARRSSTLPNPQIEDRVCCRCVASRYTAELVAWFDCNTQVLLRIVPTITQSYTTFSAADLELA